MKKLFFLSSLLILSVLGCQQSDNSTAAETAAVPSFEPNQYVLFDIPGSDLKRVEKRDSLGRLLETGILDGNVRTGTWVTYFPSTGMPAKTYSLVDGKYNGPYFEYTTRGQVELIANYKDSKLHGFWGKYFFSRPEIIANYEEGKLDGVYRKYHRNKNVLQEEVNYHNGVIDGKYRYYNEDGRVTIEYDYKNGKKVGGGMVE